jgi:hypothetical protein
MKVRCPHCNARLGVRDELRGRTGRCPRCRNDFPLEPDLSASEVQPPLDPWAGSAEKPKEKPKKVVQETDSSGEEFRGVEPLRLVASSRPKKNKNSVLQSAEIEVEDEAEAKPKRRRRITRTTWGMLLGVVAEPFWRSALKHFPYLAAALLSIGALLGFLVGLAHNAAAAGFVFNIIGFPTAILVLFMMSYPTACFWKVVVGSADSSGDIHEWPESNLPEWFFEMLFVGYLVLISLLFSGGVAKVREWVAPDESGGYWQLMARDKEVDTLSLLPKLIARIQDPKSPEVESPRPELYPGPGWQTTFAAFIVLFPLVLISCLDPKTPVYVPWSPRVLFSLLKNFPAWFVVSLLSGGLLTAAAAVLILGAAYAPFWTFTLCSPLAAIGLLLYGRLLGRLAWLIART